MTKGKVIGQVWGTRRAAGLDGRKLLLVAIDGSERVICCVDTLDAGVGDAVLVSWGSGARNVLQPGPDNRHVLCDAAVSLVVDGTG